MNASSAKDEETLPRCSFKTRHNLLLLTTFEENVNASSAKDEETLPRCSFKTRHNKDDASEY